MLQRRLETTPSRLVGFSTVVNMGLAVSDNQVELLMARAGIKGLPGNRRPRPRHETPTATATDLVERMFTREVPNRLWVTDITEYRTYEGKLYCAVVLDTFSRRVVGWSIDSSQTAALVTNALGMAIANRDPHPGVIVHSDHGVQGGFQWSSQHLDDGGVWWRQDRVVRRRTSRVFGGSGARIGLCGHRCGHRGVLSPRVRFSVRSGG